MVSGLGQNILYFVDFALLFLGVVFRPWSFHTRCGVHCTNTHNGFTNAMSDFGQLAAASLPAFAQSESSGEPFLEEAAAATTAAAQSQRGREKKM